MSCVLVVEYLVQTVEIGAILTQTVFVLVGSSGGLALAGGKGTDRIRAMLRVKYFAKAPYFGNLY